MRLSQLPHDRREDAQFGQTRYGAHMTDRPKTPPHVRILGTAAYIPAGNDDITFSPTQRIILARLALAAPDAVHIEGLADAVWGAEQPATARQAVHNQVSRIRHIADADIIATTDESYRLTVATDAQLLAQLVVDAEKLMTTPSDEPPATSTSPEDDPAAQAAFALADQALGLPHGEALSDLAEINGVTSFRSRVATAIAAAETIRLEAALRLHRRSWALLEAQRLAAHAPYDERAAANYARALAANGRRGEAVATLARLRHTLRTELGLEAGPDLIAAEYAILHYSPAPNRPSRSSPIPVVGRDNELRIILQSVAQRKPVRVRGEHGSGVSRMLFEARTRLTALGVTAVLVRAEEHSHSATSLIEEILTELGIAVDNPQSALTTFTTKVRSLTADTPTVFLIDDVQFVGPSTWQAIKTVVAADYGGVILGGHQHVVPLDGEFEVQLGPLNHEQVATLAHHYGVKEPGDVINIFQASGGNPLAVRVLADAHGTTVPMTSSATAEEPGIAQPPAMAAFADQLIGHRSDNEWRDVQLAAVAGDGYPTVALAQIDWPHPPAPPQDLVEFLPNGTLRFRHGAVASHIYHSIPSGMALDLHYALGVAARDVDAPAGTVARHMLAAAELDPALAIAATVNAAQAASALGAHADAAEWLSRAIAVSADLGQPADMRLRINHADALRLAGDPLHLPLLTQVAHDALEGGDDELIAAAGFALLQLGGSSPAGTVADDITDLAERIISTVTDDELRATVQAAASLTWSMTGHAHHARSLFDAAESAATSPSTRLQVLPFAYLALGRPVDLERRTALAVELVELSRAAKQPVALFEGLHLTFSVALQRGDGIGARTALAEMQSLIDQVGDVGRRWSVLYCSATLAQIDGDFARCETLANQAHATFRDVSPDRAAAAYYGQLLPLRWEQGRLAELRPVCEAIISEQPGVTAWHAAAALALADGGDTDGARHHAQHALDLADDDFLWLAAHVIGGRAAALISDQDLVRKYYSLLEPWAHLVCWQGTCSYGPVAAVLADLATVLGEQAAANNYRQQSDRLTTGLRATT